MARPDGPGSRPSGHAPTDREASPVDPSRGPSAVSRIKQLEALEDWLVAHAGIGTWAANSTAKALLRHAESPLVQIRSELPETLDTGNLVHDVRTLRMAHDSMHRHAYRWGKAALLLLPFVDMAAGEGLEWAEQDRWGKAALLLLPFVDMAAGEGLEWAEQDDGSPRMDAADLCAAFARAMGCEIGDAAYTAMLTEGRDAIRAAAPAGEARQGQDAQRLDPKDDHAVGESRGAHE